MTALVVAAAAAFAGRALWNLVSGEPDRHGYLMWGAILVVPPTLIAVILLLLAFLWRRRPRSTVRALLVTALVLSGAQAALALSGLAVVFLRFGVPGGPEFGLSDDSGEVWTYVVADADDPGQPRLVSLPEASGVEKPWAGDDLRLMAAPTAFETSEPLEGTANHWGGVCRTASVLSSWVERRSSTSRSSPILDCLRRVARSPRRRSRRCVSSRHGP